MEEFIIRKLDELDNIEDIIEIENELSFPLKKEDIYYEINENPVSNFLVSLIDNKIIAYIDYWITFDSSTIFKLCVKKSYRNKKIATLLLNEMFKDLKSKECLYSTLEVRVNNIPAINLYKKFKYKEVDVKKGYYSDFSDALYMVRGIYE